MEGKRRKVSKKGKKNWRKHSNIKDVEEFLEDRSREEIFGLPASEKADEDLFFVQRDITDDSSARQPSRAKLGQKPLKSEQTLKAQCSGDSSSDEEYDRSVSYRAISEGRQNRLLARQKERPGKPTTHVACKDLWSEEPEKVVLDDEHYLKVTRKCKVKRPKTLSEVPSLLRSVEVPHAGMSYNPTYQDHQDLLRTALSIEEEKARASEKLERKLQMAKLTHEEREKVWMQEMSEGIPGEKASGLSSGEEGGGGEEEEANSIGKRPIRAEERKTKKQRRKELLRRKEEMMKKVAKAQKRKMQEIYRLRSIKRELLGNEDAISRKKAASLRLKQLSPYLTKRLGRHVFEESSIPLQLSSEITGSLRSLKPEGSIAEERFKSLQKRNMIEPRELVRPHRKYKLLVKEKRSAKIPEDKNY